MSKEAEISITGISCHDTLLPNIKQIKGGHVSQVCDKNYKAVPVAASHVPVQFFFEAVEQNCLIPPSMTIIFS